MNRHVVLTDETVDDAALLAALQAAGIDAQVKPLHLQRLAKVAADILSEYTEGEQQTARDTLLMWIDNDTATTTLRTTGFKATPKPLNLQRAAKVAADIIQEYPAGEQKTARDTLLRWIDEALDAELNGDA